MEQTGKLFRRSGQLATGFAIAAAILAAASDRPPFSGWQPSPAKAQQYPLRLAIPAATKVSSNGESAQLQRANGLAGGLPLTMPGTMPRDAGNLQDPEPEGIGPSSRGASDHVPQNPASDFRTAFSGLEPPNMHNRQTRGTLGSIMAIDYSLDGQSSGRSSQVETKKLVRTRSGRQQMVSLRIRDDSTILVKSAEIEALLGGDPLAIKLHGVASRRAKDGYVEFRTLREAGIDVRYDAVSDTVFIAGSKT